MPLKEPDNSAQEATTRIRACGANFARLSAPNR